MLHFCNRWMAVGAWSCLVAMLFFFNLQGSGARIVANHYNFQDLLGALDWKVRSDDLLVLDGINNVHYYLDRFQKRKYLSLYAFLRTYKTMGDKEIGKNAEKEKNNGAVAVVDPWADLSGAFQQTWAHHHKVWILTETVTDFDGGRQLLEETLKLPQGRVKDFFGQYQLEPVTYHRKVYFYEVVRPMAEPKRPRSMNAPSGSVTGKTTQENEP